MLVIAASVPVGAVWQLVLYFRGKAKAGVLLLDCGPYPKRGVTYLVAVGLFIYFGLTSVQKFVGGSKRQGAVALLFALSGVALGFIASGRLQFREHGIWGYVALIEWKRLKSYRWDGNVLVVAWRTPFRIARGVLLVPVELQPRADDLLKQYAPAEARQS
jgi:hypothetical protein